MRVLILTQWFPPEPVGLLLELAQGLTRLGHTVETLTGFPNYPYGKVYEGYRQRLWSRDRVEGIGVTRVPLYPDHSRSAIRRAASFVSFAASATVLAAFLVRRPDVIFVYGSPYTTALPARFLKLIWRVPFVFNVQDLWPDSLEATGMLSTKTSRLAHILADWVYRNSSSIVALSAGVAQRIVRRKVPDEKVHVISNWVDVERYPRTGRDEGLRAELGLEGKFVVMYAGAIGPPQALGSAVEAAALLREDERMRLVFVGDGLDLSLLKEKVKSLGLSNVLFLGRRPESEMPRMFSIADALLVHLRPGPELDVTIPHKVFAYMASAKAILAAVGRDAANVVEENHCGVACSPGDPSALAQAIRRLAAMTPEQLRVMGENGRAAAVQLYSKERLIGQMASVLEAAAGEV